MKTVLLFLIMIGLNLCGCRRDSIIYSNKSLEDIILLAKKQSKPFCLVLIDANQNLSNDYISYLSDNYEYLTEKLFITL